MIVVYLLWHFTLRWKEDEMLSVLLDRVPKDLMLSLLNGIKKHIYNEKQDN